MPVELTLKSQNQAQRSRPPVPSASLCLLWSTHRRPHAPPRSFRWCGATTAPPPRSGFAGWWLQVEVKEKKSPYGQLWVRAPLLAPTPHPNSPEGGWLRGPLLRRKASWLKATSFSAEGGGQWGNLIYLTSTGRFWQILVDINLGISKTRLLNSASWVNAQITKQSTTQPTSGLVCVLVLSLVHTKTLPLSTTTSSHLHHHGRQLLHLRDSPRRRIRGSSAELSRRRSLRR